MRDYYTPRIFKSTTNAHVMPMKALPPFPILFPFFLPTALTLRHSQNYIDKISDALHCVRHLFFIYQRAIFIYLVLYRLRNPLVISRQSKDPFVNFYVYINS